MVRACLSTDLSLDEALNGMQSLYMFSSQENREIRGR